MLYRAPDKTALEMVRGDISEERVAELAKLPGQSTEDGKPIECVQLVFLVPGKGEEHLSLCKRYGVGCRAFDSEGNEHVLFEGSRSRNGGPGKAEGQFMPILREESWPHLNTILHRRLLPGTADQGPWITFGLDVGDSIVRVSKDNIGNQTIEDVQKRAVENLGQRTWDVGEVSTGVWAIRDEYAAESILLPHVMRRLQKELATEMMLVNIPTERTLIALSGDDMERTEIAITLARKHFDEAKGRRISPHPLIVQDGAIIGFVGTTTNEPRESTKPWWKFW